jgi:DNA-binding PadR family transcriptional regulator
MLQRENPTPYGRRRIKKPQLVRGETVMVPTELRPVEKEILRCAVLYAVDGRREFYGYKLRLELSSNLVEGGIRNGALYKALHRLELWGMLESRPEQVSEIPEHHGCRRILYSVTPAGASRVLTS